MTSVESDASSAASSSRPNNRENASGATSSGQSRSRHASSSSLAKLTYAFPARPAGSSSTDATGSVTGSASATSISSAASSGRAGDNDDAGSIRSALSETSDPFKYDAVYTSSTRGLSHLAAPSVSSLHEAVDRSSGLQGQMRQRTIGVAARNKELPPAQVSPLSASPTEQYLVAKHDYTGTPGVCLSFSAGQLIKLVSKHESGWWDGELDGQRGWFPSNFVDESLEAAVDSSSRPASPEPSQPVVRLQAQPMKRGASAPSPSLAGHSVDTLGRSNEGTESSRPPSPAFDASRRVSESDDLLAPITHAVDVMRKAVAANRISHYRPATTCLISAVRSVLHAAGCLARESVILRTHVILSRERKQILSILAHLITQSKNAAVLTLSPASRAIEVDAMVQLTDSVLNNVEHFLATAARCGISLPSNTNDTAFESTSSASSFSTANLSSDSASFSSLRLDPNVERVFGLQEISTPNLDACLQFSQYEGVVRHSSTSSHHATEGAAASGSSWTSSKAAHKARTFSEAKAAVAAHGRRKGSEASATSSSGSAGSPLSAIPPLSAITGGADFKNFDFLARPPTSSQTGANSATPPVHPGMLRRPSIPAAYATGTIPSPAWPASANDSISSASSLSSSVGPLTPANGQGVARGPVGVYRALSLIHDQLLSHIAAFVGQVHAHSRTSHSSSHAQLIEMARGTTDMVHEALCMLDAVVAHPSLAQHTKDIKSIRRHRETLYSVASTLVAATKRATTVSPIFDLADEARMQDQEEEEHAELLQAATGILRASADCIKASKPLLLKRGLEGVSFSVDDQLHTGPASRRESMSTEEAPSDEDVTLQHAIDSGVGSMDSTMVSPFTKRDSLHETRGASEDANDNIARQLLGDWQLSQKTAPIQPPSRRSSRPILEDGLPHLPERSGSSLSTRRGVPVPSTLNIHGRSAPGGTRPPSFSGQSATSTITPMSHDKPGPLPVLRPLNTSQSASSTASPSSAGSSPYHKAGGEAMSRDESSRGSATSTATSSYRSAFSSDVNTADTSPRSSVAFPSPADEKADWGLLEQLSSAQQQATAGSRKTSRTDYFRARSGSTPDRLMALRLSEGAGQAAAPSPLSPRPSVTPAIIEQPQQSSGSNRGWLLERDYHAKECAFNANGSVTGGTLKCLVERMTLHDQTIDASFSNTFFLTFRMFTTPLELTEALFARFKIPAPIGPAISEADLKVWQAQKLIPVRLRIYNFFKTWLESHWKPEMDSVILDPLTSFTREHMMPTMSAAAQRLIDLIQKRNILRSSHNAGRARGLTRMASAEKLKAGKPVLDGQSLNSATFPGTQSALPPAPIVSKSLYSALRTAPFAPNTVLDFDPLELARQLTIMESKLFCAIQSEELIGQDFGKKSSSRMSNVRQMSTLSTRITGWIAEIILSEQDAKKRTGLVKYFIKLGDRCLTLQNYHTLMAILAALNSSTISRLKKTWEGLSNKYKAILEVLRKATECSRNYAEYRSHIRTAVAPCLPFLGIYLTDITFCFDGNPSHRASPLEADLRLINFDRYQRIARIVSDLQRFQQPFNLIEVPEIQTFLHGALANIENGGDPQALYRRSLQVEPRQNQQEPVTAAPIKDIFGWRI